MSVGPWKPIRLESYGCRIDDLRVTVSVSESLDASIKVNLSLLPSSTSIVGSAEVNLNSANGDIIFPQNGTIDEEGKCEVRFDCKKGDLDLWWPVGYGKQALYTIEVIVKDPVSIPSLHSLSRTYIIIFSAGNPIRKQASKDRDPSRPCRSR